MDKEAVSIVIFRGGIAKLDVYGMKLFEAAVAAFVTQNRKLVREDVYSIFPLPYSAHRSNYTDNSKVVWNFSQEKEIGVR